MRHDPPTAAFTSLLALAHPAHREGKQLAPPTSTWIYGTAALHRRIVLVLLARFFRRFGDRLGITGLHSYYTTAFDPPADWILAHNDYLTRAVSQTGGTRLREMVFEQVRRMQDDVTRCGVTWGTEARLVIKGSCGTVALFAPTTPVLCGFSRPRFQAIAGVVRGAFAHSDIDLDLLPCPFMSPERFDHVRLVLCRCAAACVARLKRRLDGSRLGASVCEQLRSAHHQPARRRSFVIQPAFRSTLDDSLPPPSAGLSCISILAEVGSFPGPSTDDRPIRVPSGSAYASSNELHFMNGAHEVRFSLFRCMLAFLSSSKRVHAEVLDISVPHLTRSQLARRWAQPTVHAPDADFGRVAQVLAPAQQLHTLIETFQNAGQKHKLQKRARRILLLMVVLVALRGTVRTGSKLRIRALCLGATVEDLQCLPARVVQEVLDTGVVEWEALTSVAGKHLRRGHVFWEPDGVAQ